jgi:hypothetical protein
MPPITELILYYVPVTLVSCVVYASVKRDSPREIVLTGLRYFVLFTLLIAVLVAVIELLPMLVGG